MTSHTATPTDAGLVARVVGGDRAAFGVLYARHAPLVGRRLLRILGTRPEAEDVLQQTFLEVHRSLPRYSPQRPFAAWLHGIALNLSIRALRARSRRAWFRLGETGHSADAPDPMSAELPADERLVRGELMVALQAAMSRLSAKKRVAFALHEIDGMGFTEIAEVLGETTQTVWARVDSARKAIQKDLGTRPRANATPPPGSAKEVS